IAGAIAPMTVEPDVLHRDMLVLGVLTMVLFAFGIGWRGPGRINRAEGALLLVSYVGYLAYLVAQVMGVPLPWARA
ncbi:MAG: hypothetical protein IKH84_07595, partial [Ottowia sp.]|nr:hypothetical protein [Ottowia sp.]